jgi:hypothetical protein
MHDNVTVTYILCKTLLPVLQDAFDKVIIDIYIYIFKSTIKFEEQIQTTKIYITLFNAYCSSSSLEPHFKALNGSKQF